MAERIQSNGNAKVSIALDKEDGIIISDMKGKILARIESDDICIINIYQNVPFKSVRVSS